VPKAYLAAILFSYQLWILIRGTVRARRRALTVQRTVGSLWAPPRTPGFSGFTELHSVKYLLASSAACLLGSRVRKSPEVVNLVCCQVEVSATDRSLV
jgi:hypothetical protein